MDASTAPPDAPPSLYDIGAFFARSLNLTADQARAFVDGAKERLAATGLEHDQDEVLVVPFDELADLIAGFDRLVAMWEDDRHVLVVGEQGWSIEHSLRCRATGAMEACPRHRDASDLVDRLGLDVGRWVFTDQGNEPVVAE